MTEAIWSDSAGLCRIRGRSGQVVGTAFLVAADLVLTCAHVVTAALGGDRHDSGPPADPVCVEFPLVGVGGAEAGHCGTVVGWQPARLDGSGDTALLRLDRPAPPQARRVRLTLTEAVWGDEVRVFGFPVDLPEEYGVWVAAELRARQGAGWLQVESSPQQRRIGPGFSGSPVWGPGGGVVGMIVAAERANTTAYLIPVRTLVEAHPEIAAPDPAESCPYRGLDPFLEEHAAHFRGRAALTDRLASLVDRQPLVTLAGPSGSGKSSLVYAGLMPRLRERGTLVTAFRPLPGMRPAALLADSVIGVLDPALDVVGRHDEAASLADRLDATPETTVPWLAGRLIEQVGDSGLLIFGDQFEELAPTSARRLWELLHHLVTVAPRRAAGAVGLCAVLTVRSGALDALVTEETAQAARDGMLFVPPMSRSQLRDAVTAADVEFEPGLVSRILDDAGAEPGSLPLTEFTLARLWQRRHAGSLTHRSYEELGTVAGALAGYADEVYRHRLSGAEQPAARRLLVQLARPEPDGGFARRPVRLGDLDDEPRGVLARLAASRLVVVSRAPDGAEVADLAHQALIGQWPRLRRWLTEEREFRSWQESLRADLARWEATGRDPGGLLRGAPLATAVGWTREHPEDVSAAEHDYVRASRARTRRRDRIRRSAVAAITVLAVTAGGLAALAARQTERAEGRLRTAASRTLADESVQLRATDPGASLQLALAAWHHDRTAEASGALFGWYAALQSVEKVYRGWWDGDIDEILTSRDGSVVVFVNDGGLPSVWTGMTGANPARWEFTKAGRRYPGGDFAISASGRYLGYANGLGGVLLWDIERRTGPMELAPTRQVQDLAEDTDQPRVAFSPDGARLLTWSRKQNDRQAILNVWDVGDGRRVPVANPLRPEDDPRSVSFGPSRDTLLVTDWSGPARLYDLGTGRLVRSFPGHAYGGATPARDGELLTRCDDDRFWAVDTASGRERFSFPVDSCLRVRLDAGSEYAAFTSSPEAGQSHDDLSVVDLGTGRTYRFTAPPIDFGQPRVVGAAMFRGPDGHPTALLADRSQGYRLHATGPEPLAVRFGGGPFDAKYGSPLTVTPDERFELWIDDDFRRVGLWDAAGRRTVATATLPPVPAEREVPPEGGWFDFSPDGTRLLVIRGDELVVYAVPALTLQRRMRLPVQATLGRPLTQPGLATWASSVVPDHDGRVVVLHAGQLTRWDPATGRQIDAALPLRTQLAGQRRSALLAVAARPARPGHPGEVAVLEPDGSVEVWSLDRRAVVATVPAESGSRYTSVLFDPSGDRLATLSRNGQVTLWDIGGDEPVGRSVPTGTVAGLVGFTSGGRLLTIRTSGSLETVQLWDDDSGKPLATLGLRTYSPRLSLEDERLGFDLGGQARSLSLAPQEWVRRLCALNDRPYTAAERQVLERHGAMAEKPCG
ncbi:trypsin-like peptidase domain-containing protein [Micromonospora mirobrigensis]|uniref:AAA ATPase domain-containing protein n=1 Tax=Micromonospora mirobrigensis TaxID=262898 RepID=A0A1C4Z751_9ACTN|nr:trypsin-like peptidase domain-containing protein [Micromonospora mirobrigensis]SCF28471.1 AAA ATPase domain-containing protein [Micromonospora mirobrigensis]